MEGSQFIEEKEKDYLLMLQSMKQSRANYQAKERFLSAEKQVKKINDLKGKHLKETVIDVEAKQKQEQHLLEHTFLEEVKAFNANWEANIKKFKDISKTEEYKLLVKHDTLLKKRRQLLELENPIRYKPSSALLDMIETKEKASKTRQYVEADYLKKQIKKSRGEELSAYLNKRNMRIKNGMILFEKKLHKEVVNLQSKQERVKGEMEKYRVKEYEQLVKRFDNLCRELKIAQKIELNKSVGKHITGVGTVVPNYFTGSRIRNRHSSI